MALFRKDKLTGTSLFDEKLHVGSLSPYFISDYVLRYLTIVNLLTANETIQQYFKRPLTKSILSCAYNFQPCKIEDFSYYINTQYGYCLSFEPKQGINRAGSMNGLQMTVFLEENDFTLDKGLHIALNSEIKPTLSEGVNISPGQRTNIEYTKKITKNLPAPHSNCFKDNFKSSSDLVQAIQSLNVTYKQRYSFFYVEIQWAFKTV